MIGLFGASNYFEFGKIDIPIPVTLFYALLGILVVFVCLVIIILLLTLLDKIFKYNIIDKITGGIKKFFGMIFKRKRVQNSASIQEDESNADLCEDEDVIAAIMAAVTVMMADEAALMQTDEVTNPPVPFKIKSIKHNHNH